ITAAVTGAFIILFALSVSSGGMDSLLASLHYKIKSSAMPAGILDSTRKLIKDGLLSIFLVSASFFVVAFFAIKGRIKGAFTAAFIIAAINCADAGRVMSRFITFEDYNRFVARDNAIASAIRNAGGIKRCLNFEQAFGPNRNIYYGIESLRGMHGLMPSDYMEMEKAGVFGNIQVNRLFNITHYLSDREMAVPGIEKVYESSGIILYMDTLAKNRVFFAGSLRKAGSKKQALDIMKQGFDGSYSIAEPDFPMGEYGLRQGSVSVTSYSPNRVAAVVESAEGGAVVHASAYYSEWKAKIDGRNTPVYRVNYMSMAVQAPPGRHEIEFYYDDSSTRTGIFLLLTGVLILTGAAFASRRAG
ncbi:MAG TPA: YfhO family protein, partial [Candidatus Goldiibacteriota bacterium]|nr:YfhO family protein [Candidatus Goldiibacteriota bacterium]